MFSTNVKIITIPTTNEINDFGSLRAIKVVLVWKERFNTAGVLKNYLYMNTRVKLVNTGFIGV